MIFKIGQALVLDQRKKKKKKICKFIKNPYICKTKRKI